MRPLVVGAMLVGALVGAAAVWLSVGADVVNVAQVAGWWTLLVLAFPAFMTFAVKRGWGDTL